MKFASLGSGSRGNATLIQCQDTCLLLDCGFTLKESESRLARAGIHATQLDAILVTHEHGDHANGVGVLARKYDIPVYLTIGTYRQSRIGRVPCLELINSHQLFRIKEVEITPVPVPHDAREPCQFVFKAASKSLGVLTDLGSLTPHIQEQYSGLDALLLECNHDLQMLEEGPYPHYLKRRVGGDYGHLNNRQAAELLRRIETDALQHLVISHISEQNNKPELAVAEIQAATGCEEGWLTVADQESGFDWRTIA